MNDKFFAAFTRLATRDDEKSLDEALTLAAYELGADVLFVCTQNHHSHAWFIERAYGPQASRVPDRITQAGSLAASAILTGEPIISEPTVDVRCRSLLRKGLTVSQLCAYPVLVDDDENVVLVVGTSQKRNMQACYETQEMARVLRLWYMSRAMRVAHLTALRNFVAIRESLRIADSRNPLVSRAGAVLGIFEALLGNVRLYLYRQSADRLLFFVSNTRDATGIEDVARQAMYHLDQLYEIGDTLLIPLKFSDRRFGVLACQWGGYCSDYQKAGCELLAQVLVHMLVSGEKAPYQSEPHVLVRSFSIFLSEERYNIARNVTYAVCQLLDIDTVDAELIQMVTLVTVSLCMLLKPHGVNLPWGHLEHRVTSLFAECDPRLKSVVQMVSVFLCHAFTSNDFYASLKATKEHLTDKHSLIAALEVAIQPHLMGSVDPIQVPLTRREREVLVCLAQGLDNLEISQKLRIRQETVRVHVSRILQKLGVTDRTKAALLALQTGLAES